MLRAFSKFCTTQLSLKSIPPFGQNQGQAATGLPPDCQIESARDKGQNLFCKRNDDAAGQGEETVGALARVMAFQRKADLHNAEAEQDKADGADQQAISTTAA